MDSEFSQAVQSLVIIRKLFQMYFWNLIFFVFAVKVNGDLKEGDTCAKDGKTGICRIIDNCPSAIRGIVLRRPPMTCSFMQSTPVVCCFDDLPSTATTATTATTTTTSTSSKATTGRIPPSPGNRLTDGCSPLAANMTSQLTGRKAWDKCIEYQLKYVYPCEKSVAFTNDKVRVNHCGHVADQLVVGGENANTGEFPHMALLGYGSSSEVATWLCGGTVLSERYVLTAGHCTSNRDNVEVTYVQTGMLRKSQRIPQRVYRVSRILKHPQYDPPRKYNDIAILQTENEILLDSAVVPACLPVTGDYDDSRASAIGFGLLNYKGSSADRLQKVVLNKFSTEECSEKYPPERLMKNGFQETTQMCFGDKSASKDTCQGDSGGPLQIHNKNAYCMYVVVGVTSFGRGCGFVGEPGIYTKVHAYVPWIETVVWPN